MYRPLPEPSEPSDGGLSRGRELVIDSVSHLYGKTQQQRVALARALAIGPDLLLLDEPFAALDKSLRLDMQIEVRALQRKLGITSILVTHDHNEALSLSDKLVVLNGGKALRRQRGELAGKRRGTSCAGAIHGPY